MKLKGFILAAIFLSLTAAVNVRAQFDITGSISGRVTSANGNGIRRARVTVLNLTTLESQTRIANDFGYFRFNSLPILNLYLVSVGSKSYDFSFADQLVQFTTLEHSITFISDN